MTALCLPAFATLCATPLIAQSDSTSLSDMSPRGSIALVLAGGGAKGAAHIGVLKALEEMRIPVDYVTGTSMGAFVGGLYATGMSASEIERFIEEVDWNQGYRDRVSRGERRIRDKENEDRFQLRTDLGINLNSAEAPRGVVQGQNMLRILRHTTGNLPALSSFDQLAVPFRSVATDILALEEVVIDNGYLVDAMMASMSVPGALPPYELQGTLLVDGGVINNMPVDVARDMGADHVIAVDISTDYKKKQDFTSLFVVADQLSNFMVRRSTAEQAATLTQDDVYLKPEVGSMETTEFDRMTEAFDAGYQIAYQNQAALARYALTPADYQAYQNQKLRQRRALERNESAVIDRVVLENSTHFSDEWLNNHLQLTAGRAWPDEAIEEKIEALYALDRFERITYRFEPSDSGEKQLVVAVEEKSWGPSYLNFRFFLEDDFNTDSQYGLGTSALYSDIGIMGAELLLNLEMGTDKHADAELFVPLFTQPDWFTSGRLGYSSTKRSVPIDGFDNPPLEAAYDYFPITYNQTIAELAIGYQPAPWQEYQLGTRYNDGFIEYTNVQSAGRNSYKRIGAFARYRFDNLDSFLLPSTGQYFNAEVLLSHDDSPAIFSSNVDGEIVRDTVTEITLAAKVARTFSRHTLVGHGEYEVVKSKNAYVPLDPKSIGGFLNLSGIPRNSLIGQNKFFTSLEYRYRWFDNDFGLFEAPVYLGASIEYGGVWSDTDLNLSNAPLYLASSVFTGIDSPIGPVVLAYGRTEQNLDAVYLIIGTSFR
ncbi:patatin-like phospholipase family protein [Vibrio agarilyticus]